MKLDACKRGWLWLLLFAALWCAFRVFWLSGDAGIPSVWEYGYNVTDEGYYMGAAKDKLLRGRFNDLVCGESFTYGYSAGTHWLSYLGYAVFGLADWSFRVPFLLLYFVAWCMAFRHVAARHGNAMAFCWTAAFSLMPVVVVYERTAGNDVAIGALTAIAFCTAAGKGVWRIPLAALVTGAIVLVKPSVWVLMPMVAASVLSERKTRSALLDVASYVVLAVAAVYGWKLAAALSVWSEAAEAGMSGFELIRRTTTHNPLPSLFDLPLLFKGFSSFPRDPTMALLSVSSVFVSVAPMAMALRNAVRRRWDWRVPFGLAMAAYVAAISVMNSIYTHYFHPVLMLLPMLWCAVVPTVGEEESAAAPSAEKRLGWKGLLACALALLAGSSVLLFMAADVFVKPQTLQNYYSTISNLPLENVWGFSFGWALAAAVLTTVLLAVWRGWRGTVRESWLWFVLAFAVGSVAFAGFPAVHFALYLKRPKALYLAPSGLVLCFGLLFLLVFFGRLEASFRRRLLAWFPVAAIVASFALAPSWRNAAVEMVRPPRHVLRAVAEEIAKIVPEDAVVVGERSRQTLMGHGHRTATTMPGCDPIPIVRGLFEKNADEKVYALLDTQNAYNLKHFQEHASEFRLELLRTFAMPSFANGEPAKVHLCRVRRVRQGGLRGNEAANGR